MLDLKRLRLLSELSRRGTIAEVASVVGYTPSAVSQSLAQLERETGVALLERDGRRVRLTPAAHGLVAATDRVLAELDAAEAELAAEHETVRGEIVIGAFPSAAAGLVVPAVAELDGSIPSWSAPSASTSPRTASRCCARARSTCSSPRATTTSRAHPSVGSSRTGCSPSRCCS